MSSLSCQEGNVWYPQKQIVRGKQCQEEVLTPTSTRRDERKRLRHALLPRAIPRLLLTLPLPLPPPSAPSASFACLRAPR